VARAALRRVGGIAAGAARATRIAAEGGTLDVNIPARRGRLHASTTGDCTMTIRPILAFALLCLAAWSCAPSGQGGPSAAPNTSAAGEVAPAAKTSSTPASSIPKDARWTIFCATVNGREHVAQSKLWCSQLQSLTGMKQFYLVHGSGESTLYYGFYREINERVDKAEASRVHADRKALSALVDPNTGGMMFRGVLVVALDDADPVAPPEWNLANARARGYYSLQVGVYKDSPQRKLYAVDAVREARKEGYEAYYFHGPTASSVCIGVWPESAVKKPQVKSTNSKRDIVVVPGDMPVPNELTEGRTVDVVHGRTEILDASLLATMQKFPILAVNGLENFTSRDTRTGEVKKIEYRSALVVIPQQAQEQGGSRQVDISPDTPSAKPPARVATDDRTPPAPPANADNRPASKGGKLKSIEDRQP
jgi:hypothetical protein